jgi:hypothetical protein
MPYEFRPNADGEWCSHMCVVPPRAGERGKFNHGAIFISISCESKCQLRNAADTAHTSPDQNHIYFSWFFPLFPIYSVNFIAYFNRHGLPATAFC